MSTFPTTTTRATTTAEFTSIPGFPNRAFYLAATAIGGHAWEKAGRIWYAALTERLQPDSDFNAAAEATVEVAGELFGDGGEQKAVEEAWRRVGVG